MRKKVGRQRWLSFFDWSLRDTQRRYKRAFRILNGDKKHLSPVELEFKRAVLKARDLSHEI